MNEPDWTAGAVALLRRHPHVKSLIPLIAQALNAAYTAGLAAQREGEIRGLEKARDIAQFGPLPEWAKQGLNQFSRNGIARAIQAEIDVLQPEAEASRHPTSDTSGPDPAADRNRPA